MLQLLTVLYQMLFLTYSKSSRLNQPINTRITAITTFYTNGYYFLRLRSTVKFSDNDIEHNKEIRL